MIAGLNIVDYSRTFRMNGEIYRFVPLGYCACGCGKEVEEGYKFCMGHDPENSVIPKGFCLCGCGQRTSIASKTRLSRGDVKGQPVKYVHGHGAKGETGELCRNWKGGIIPDSGGYTMVYSPDHPKADTRGYVYEHILVIEEAFGKPIPEGAAPHHVDSDRKNNTPSNLVLCQDHQYHHLLHQRTRAYRACGHANWLKCWICKEYDDPDNLVLRNDMTGKSGFHRECKNQYQREWKARGKR